MKIADLRGLIYLCAVFAASCSGSVKEAQSPLDEAQSPNDEAQSPNADSSCNAAWFQGKCVDVGDAVFFGQYPQATDTPEAIQWRVLEVDRTERKLLLLSEYVLDARTYNEENEESVSITWEECALRTWLNGTFKTTAFTSSEQSQIALTHLDNPNNPYWGTNGGYATDDYVFLLSLPDALSKSSDVAGSGKYFSSDAQRVAKATTYAINNGVYGYNPSDGSDTCANVQCLAIWWLRSPGLNSDNATDVHSDGRVNNHGGPVTFWAFGVRPALWAKY